MTEPEVAQPSASRAPTVAVLRLSGEVSTKARATRRQFVTRLVRNLRDALESTGLPCHIERSHERIVVAAPESRAFEPLGRIFGLQSFSIASRHEAADLQELVAIGERHFRERVAGRRFAVRARTVGGPSIAGVSGREIERALGERLLPHAARVDLSRPERTVRVEVHRGAAYLFEEREPAPGGLPLGSGDRAVALVSGGFDSAVAAWLMLRRGVELDYVFCNLGGFGHQLGTLRVMQVVANRWSYGSRPRLHAIDFSGLSRELQRVAQPRYWQVILKRLMLRATETRAQAIVTGEALGQVSSQTLRNLSTIAEASALPVLRPLVGANKDEIIRRAEQIGTAPLSAVVDEYCALVPRRPATAAKVEVVRQEEAPMDAALLQRALEHREVLDLRALDPDACGIPEIEIDHVPEGAVLIDLRPRTQYEAWHLPGALHLDFARALEAHPSFAKDQRYVLACEYGLMSAHLAELMRAVGHRAHHFRGGIRALRAWAECRERHPGR